MTRQEKYNLLTQIAQENPSDFYSTLVTEYKKYDSNQKRIISELIAENKKLKVKVGQLESYVEEIVSEENIVVPKTTIKEYKSKIQNLNQQYLLIERHLIELMFPQYSKDILPKGVIGKIHKLIKEVLNEHEQ